MQRMNSEFDPKICDALTVDCIWWASSRLRSHIKHREISKDPALTTEKRNVYFLKILRNINITFEKFRREVFLFQYKLPKYLLR